VPLPILSGRSIRVAVRASLGAHIAASSIPGRRIYLDSSVFSRRGEFERILTHELFHFCWVRLSNAKRRAWEQVLAREIAARARGELGWSAEWRKKALLRGDALLRTPRWRRYACESFCDTAAWIYSGLHAHDEFTLTARARAARRKWFAANFSKGATIAI
jgi:hypothetical protein